MRKAVALSIFLVLASAASAQIYFKGTLDEAMAKAKTANKKILLDFMSYT